MATLAASCLGFGAVLTGRLDKSIGAKTGNREVSAMSIMILCTVTQKTFSDRIMNKKIIFPKFFPTAKLLNIVHSRQGFTHVCSQLLPQVCKSSGQFNLSQVPLNHGLFFFEVYEHAWTKSNLHR